MQDALRCAVITPYYREPRHFLERCIESVRCQTASADHFLISDGFSQEWLDNCESVRHLKLGKNHGDYGNTPRGLGALLAIAEGYNAVCFLDADNWIEPNHIQTCIETAAVSFGSIDECDCVFAKRLFKRFDETTMPISEEPNHVDTNCYFFLPGSFHMLSIWVTMPKYMSSLGDRFFYSALSARKFRVASTMTPTVNYHCTFASLYRAIGEVPPIGCKENIRDELSDKIRVMSERDLEILFRLTGGLRFSV